MLPLLFSAFFTPSLAVTCTSQTQPNPIAQDYPNDATGVINGTTAIVPIPYAVARSIVPAQYSILTSAYRTIFPSLPPDLYPAVLEALHDHDVRAFNFSIPDFSRSALRFPFVDRLNDGHTSFKYGSPILISKENAIAVNGSAVYGTTYPATFVPECDAYAADACGGTFMNASVFLSTRNDSKPDIGSVFQTTGAIPYTLKAFMNITNQPIFGDAPSSLCDNYITLFNTSITAPPYAPVPVKGTVSVRPPVCPKESVFEEVYGFRMANAFVERNAVPCESLGGYHGTGEGDSG
ncbi:hypothetical protein BU23DRAFT_512474 [Bimuria novae-zelandiae CBS 107.79]|uniref:Uncharacterized protein n=1 Tax=Bimuria novae-zelandiae CBS 107.79 TaxID=1447943 RepID=A0A6A5UY30_9PLEO|nr:hypothetical protein BU23DRAFT_512474 [Bimuria novae-zelandiae CBS 107.79]